MAVTFKVNGASVTVDAPAATPLLMEWSGRAPYLTGE
jgi:hypothetical protein